MFYGGDLDTRFSGTVMYSTVTTNLTVQVERYRNGKLCDIVSLFNKELYAIYQAYMGIKYDISFCKAYNDKGIVTQFYCSDFFEIPFEDLKY